MTAIRYAPLASPIGELVAFSEDEAGLSGLEFADSHRAPIDPSWERDDAMFAELAAQLKAYFARELTTFDLPLRPRGTEFQRRVWEALRKIPYGATTTYGRIAAELGHAKAMRAVGLANGRNPISIIIPCHRVIGTDGSLTGYGGGMERKRWLLAHESGAQALPW